MLAAEKTSSIRERVITGLALLCPAKQPEFFFFHYTAPGAGRTGFPGPEDVLL
jgi:hypothetical protein